MPNTFGTSSLRVELIDPRDARRYRERFRRDAIPQLNLANSLYVPVGKTPSRGWILLVREDYDKIRGYGTQYQLEVDQFDATAPALTFKNLSIVQARCVTTGLSASPEAVYLVELTDARGVLCNNWFQFPTISYYNVLSPAYPALYYSASMNGVVPYTWSTLAKSLWDQMGSFLGTFPGLAGDVSGTPTNWNLPGVSAWEAMNAVLTHLGMGISVDLTKDSPYGVIALGGTDGTFDALTDKYYKQNRLQDDLEWIDVGAARVPGAITVYFRRVNEQYGTEETVRRDENQWATNSVYSVTINAPSTFTGAPGTGYLWDDFPVRCDVDGNPLAGDVASAIALAGERVRQYYDVIYSRTLGYMNRTYAGVLPFYAGSNVDGVCWRQDFRDQKRFGWITNVIRGELWPEVYQNG